MLVTHAEILLALQAQYVSPTWPSARFNCSFDEQKKTEVGDESVGLPALRGLSEDRDENLKVRRHLRMLGLRSPT